MANRSPIPPNLEPAILEKAGEGWPLRKITEWLKSEHDISVHFTGVGRLIAKLQAERGDIAKAVVREKLAGSLTKDIDRLEEHAYRLHRMARRHRADPVIYIKLVEQFRKLTDTKLHYSGADTPDDGATELLQRAERIRSRLAPAPPAGPAPGGASADSAHLG